MYEGGPEAPAGIDNLWADKMVLRSALVAANVRRGGAPTSEELDSAIERCDEVLEYDPGSVPARLVRATLRAKAGRTFEADEDTAEALVVVPELADVKDPVALAWIAPRLEGARKLLSALLAARSRQK
jgi:hypothetical protein